MEPTEVGGASSLEVVSSHARGAASVNCMSSSSPSSIAPREDPYDVTFVLEFTSTNKDDFDAYVLDAFQRLHMPLVKCSRKSRVDLIDGRVVKEICTRTSPAIIVSRSPHVHLEKYRCDLGGRPTPKKDGVKSRRSKSKRLDCQFSFNATMLKATRTWSITEESKAKLLALWGEANHGHCHVLDDQQLRVRRLNPDGSDGDCGLDETVRESRLLGGKPPASVGLPSSTSSADSLSHLMDQSSSIISALLKAEELEASAKNDGIKRAVQDHANTLRLALEHLTAKIKAKHT
ncbi:Aste57867_14929 [Aphanomyces stellatus]|uniref:Aste57867_14929 protein n=1 Tax=Aphanomyces stellatus TaxID=120398 RepID=A0A485L275_9STRA|nr:hypothetical protein As57867_014873 [Aphanomyces stellatus]VFT91744.1 Aste57867_14929 [Aphanomyces stellatus]